MLQPDLEQLTSNLSAAESELAAIPETADPFDRAFAEHGLGLAQAAFLEAKIADLDEKLAVPHDPVRSALGLSKNIPHDQVPTLVKTRNRMAAILGEISATNEQRRELFLAEIARRKREKAAIVADDEARRERDEQMAAANEAKWSWQIENRRRRGLTR